MPSIKEQIMRISLDKVKLSNGKTIKQNLIEATEVLLDCIQKRIDIMYNTYKPIKYIRREPQYGMRSTLYVEDFIDVDIVNNKIKISIKDKPENTWASNITGEHMSPTIVLMNNGWNAPALKNAIGKSIERFTKFEGEHFIENGIADFNKKNKWGITVLPPVINSDKWY